MKKEVDFSLSFSEPQAHYVDVAMHLRGFEDSSYLDIKMPVWAPGSYLVREYSKNVERFKAISNHGEDIKFEKISKNTWRIYHQGSPCTVSYAVYGFEVSVRTSFIDESRAFLSPVGTFMYVDGYLDLDTRIAIHLPSQWSKISTGLKTTDIENVFYAPDFDILFDSPIEIGNQDVWKFDIEGVTHECAMVGIADYDKDLLTQDITTIVREENKIWGSNPNDYYVIITHNYQNGNGGLEHLNSTVLAASRFSYSNPSTYKNYLSLVAHEYFHLWHVKRLRPKALGPFDYENENYTTGLWIIEGFTSYYDNLIIRRCGFFDEKEYLQKLAIDFNTVYNRPGYLLQSAAQSSFDTWIKHYRPDENSQNVAISYYNKGAMHAVALDIKIISETKGSKRLDDVMKAAYEQFYLIQNRGFEEKEFQELAEEITGVNLTEIFEAAHTTKDIDYNKYFNQVGYTLINDYDNQVNLGVKLSTETGNITIKNVDRNSSAWKSGLNVGDEIIAINNYRLETNGKTLDYLLQHSNVGEVLTFIIARDGIIMNKQVELVPSDKKSFRIERLSTATPEQIALGKIWLSL